MTCAFPAAVNPLEPRGIVQISRRRFCSEATSRDLGPAKVSSLKADAGNVEGARRASDLRLHHPRSVEKEDLLSVRASTLELAG